MSINIFNLIKNNEILFSGLKSSKYLHYMSPVYIKEQGKSFYICKQVKIFFRRLSYLIRHREWLNDKRLVKHLKDEESWLLNSSDPSAQKTSIIALSFLFKEFNKRDPEIKISKALDQAIESPKPVVTQARELIPPKQSATISLTSSPKIVSKIVIHSEETAKPQTSWQKLLNSLAIIKKIPEGSGEIGIITSSIEIINKICELENLQGFRKQIYRDDHELCKSENLGFILSQAKSRSKYQNVYTYKEIPQRQDYFIAFNNPEDPKIKEFIEYMEKEYGLGSKNYLKWCISKGCDFQGESEEDMLRYSKNIAPTGSGKKADTIKAYLHPIQFNSDTLRLSSKFIGHIYPFPFNHGDTERKKLIEDSKILPVVGFLFSENLKEIIYEEMKRFNLDTPAI